MDRTLVKVFEREPGLLRSLARWDVRQATKRAIAPVIELERGEWRPPLARLRTSDLGLLVLDGLIVRRTRVLGRIGVEVVGAGDVLRPWSGDEDGASVPTSLSVEVAELTHVAVLDHDFVAMIAHWPPILPEILERMSARATSLAFQLAIARIPLLESRLLCQLWHLADRWGHVDRDGVVLRIRLSQRLLADLTSSVRPSVSSALGRLSARGLVRRCGPGTYRLYGDPPDELLTLPRRSFEVGSTALDPIASAASENRRAP